MRALAPPRRLRRPPHVDSFFPLALRKRARTASVRRAHAGCLARNGIIAKGRKADLVFGGVEVEVHRLAYVNLFPRAARRANKEGKKLYLSCLAWLTL